MQHLPCSVLINNHALEKEIAFSNVHMQALLYVLGKAAAIEVLGSACTKTSFRYCGISVRPRNGTQDEGMCCSDSTCLDIGWFFITLNVYKSYLFQWDASLWDQLSDP